MSDARLPARYIILGEPPVKKNSSQIVRRGKKPFLLPSKAYMSWKDAAILQLKTQHRGDPIEGELHATFTFYVGARRKPDLSNLYEAPQDAMEEAGIINNDYFIVSHDGSRRRRDRENPRIEIALEQMK